MCKLIVLFNLEKRIKQVLYLVAAIEAELEKTEDLFLMFENICE